MTEREDDPEAKHAQFPLFDSLRAFAALSILVVHVAIFADAFDDPGYGSLIAHLDIGVPFFFLLSAFLLYRPFLASRIAGKDRTPFPIYARRRFLRIAPAYWVVLTLSAIVPGMVGAFTGNWWVYYGLLQNYPIYEPTGLCATDPFRCGVPPTWSLAVEVFFYVMLPFFVLLMAWIGSKWKRANWLVPELVAVSVLSVVSFYIQSRLPSTDLETVLFFSPIGRGWWFALGLGLAAISVWVQQRRTEPPLVSMIATKPWIPLLAGSLIYVWLALFVLDPFPGLNFPTGSIREYVGEYVAVGVIALLIVIPATFGGSGGGWFRRFLRHPVPTWLGLVSYGIFLWQFAVLIGLIEIGALEWWPSMQFPVLLVATFAGTVILAAGSYYLVERPLMRWGRRGEKAARRSEAATVAIDPNS